MGRSLGRNGFRAGRHLAVVSDSVRPATRRLNEEALLDAAERHAMLAVLKNETYAEVLIVGATDSVTAGAAEPWVMVRFPTDFAGLPG